jgi:hypothetical protein
VGGSHGAGSVGAGGSANAGAGGVAVQAADAPGGSLSFSALDVLLLLAIIAGAIGVGITIRRLARSSV